MNKALAGLIVVTFWLSGCQSTAGPNEQGGVIVGGLLGGLLGSQVGSGRGTTAATIIGSVIGAQIAGNVGRSMDNLDRMRTSHSLETIRTGVPTTWRNPDTRNEYTVVPTRTYETPAGPCREYSIDAIIGGQRDKVYGTACRQADGSWRATG